MYQKYIIWILMMVSLSGCKQFLDQPPHDEVLTEDVFTSFSNLESAMIGAYSTMQDVEYYGRNFVIMPSVSGDNIYNNLRSNRFVESATYSRTAEDANARDLWISAYQVINSCNYIIEAVGSVEASQEEKDRLKGEALAVRSLVFFDLARMYSQPYTYAYGPQGNADDKLGIPIVTQDSLTVSVDDVKFPYRSSTETVYDEIIDDLEMAVTLLPDVYPSKNRATLFATQGLLSRVYLYRNIDDADLNNVVKYATAVIDAGYSSLYPRDAFVSSWSTNGEREAVWTLEFIADQDRGADNLGSMFLPAVLGGYGDLRPTRFLRDSIDKQDIRSQLVIPELDNEDTIGYYINKYPGQSGVPGLTSPRIIRLAEIYLNRAEAYARLGMYDLAKQDLTVIIQRAYGDSYTPTFPPDDELVDFVLAERRIELYCEGHRSFDIFRTGGVMVRYDWQSENMQDIDFIIKTGAWNTILGIPQREIDVNPNLKQNPRY
ncbi:RagB/SusD family nutrient uptake outer membrane protein [Aureibacter tunicatorum]|uniref:RagB/SusD family nutrient uptake outer membrane protein n=1 Tax=Aureibacter tunicatorum TaxID=866807 RepID=A0AAE3XRU0_9BACT|nr:RagB/SusD family nutrient uptake outer membrane protein [Aureibacter tunicatorum]MDR6240908.1 hypothetical protein [Aureibacter tunicatorum]BDD03688.1 membrane protein [Aureibacter tunicatorum]